MVSLVRLTGGLQVFQIMGELYHTAGPLTVEQGQNPKFAQFFFFFFIGEHCWEKTGLRP